MDKQKWNCNRCGVPYPPQSMPGFEGHPMYAGYQHPMYPPYGVPNPFLSHFSTYPPPAMNMGFSYFPHAYSKHFGYAESDLNGKSAFVQEPNQSEETNTSAQVVSTSDAQNDCKSEVTQSDILKVIDEDCVINEKRDSDNGSTGDFDVLSKSDGDEIDTLKNPLEFLGDNVIGEEIAADDVALDVVVNSDTPDTLKRGEVQDGNMLGEFNSTLDVLHYLRDNKYPMHCSSKNEKSNFRKQCKPFKLLNGILHHKTHPGKKTGRGRDHETFPEYAKVIFNKDAQEKIIRMVHEGVSTSLEAQSLSAHRGMNSGLDIISRRAWWPKFTTQYKSYVKYCDPCQRVNTAVIKVREPLHSVPPPRENMKQIGVDIIQLPEADGFKYVVVAIDYLSKFCNAKALESKSSMEVARFLFEWICMFGCPKIVINDQGREFVNEVSEHLFTLTGVHQRITSAYNPQANGQVERQNAIIKCALLKVLRNNISRWPSILDAVLFSHRVQKQRSTGYSPFFLLFGQEPVLPVDVEENSAEEEEDELEIDVPDVTLESYLQAYEDSSLDTSTLETMAEKFFQLKQSTLLKARENIRDAQNTQKKEYDKRNNAGRKMYRVGQVVLRRNLRRDDRKGGWHQDPWLGPYTIVKILPSNSCVLKNVVTGKLFKKAQRQKNLKIFHTKSILDQKAPPKRKRRRICSEENEEGIDDILLAEGSSNLKKIKVAKDGKESSEKGIVPKRITNFSDSSEDESSVLQDDRNCDAILVSANEEESSPERDFLSSPRDVTDEELKKLLLLPEDVRLLTHGSITLKVRDLNIIHGSMWFNDEIINFYFNVISESLQSVHALDTFFYPTLTLKGQESVAKWTKNVNLFEKRFILIPIHGASHWSLISVDNESKTLTAFDSLNGDHSHALNVILDFLECEAYRHGVHFQRYDYKVTHADDIARQDNSYDCGPFICFYARRVCESKGCSASASYMSSLRLKLMKEILRCSLIEESHQELLFHCPHFVTWLEGDHEHRAQCSNQKCLACAVYKELLEYRLCKVDSDPSRFVSLLPEFWSTYRLGKQQDASEFLLVLFEAMKLEYILRFNQKLDSFYLHTTPIDFTFAGCLKQEIKCPCGITSDSLQKFTLLSINATGSDIQSATNEFLEEEIVEGSCGADCKSINRRKRFLVVEAPNVLIVHLKRFTSSGTKLTSRVTENTSLVFGEGNKYEIFGTVQHISYKEDTSLDRGHYIAYLKMKNRYYKFDDSKCTSSGSRHALRGQSYLAFYLRRD
ncbi:Sentrin-specific protease 3 [Frankliniella fusca]|uniref:RNA-directed DNA polymerase n=1 Tax=Frankliniella fusca TaxID=407009 RepID=A0AAE1HYC1_9NEOP|nr:Sentrin-specific protease 3 [Frankliniella fusca]